MNSKILRLLCFAVVVFGTVLAGFGQVGGRGPRWYGPQVADPAKCTAPALYWNTLSLEYRYCSAADTWTVLGGIPAGLFSGTPTANRFAYFTDADTVGSSDFQLEQTTGDMVTPTSKKIRAWGATDLSSFTTPFYNYNTAYSVPNSKTAYTAGYYNTTITSFGSGASAGGGLFNTLSFSGVTQSGTTYGVANNLNCSTSATCGTLYGMYGGGGVFGNVSATSISGVTGFLTNNAGNATQMRSLEGVIFMFGAGTATNIDLVSARMTANGAASGTVSNVYGLNLSGWNKGGTATYSNTYGIYADTSIDLGATNKYFIYSLSTSPSLFSGNVTVGGSGKFYVSTSRTPASASATCTTGQIVWDASYLYVCTATNTWKRASIATW